MADNYELELLLDSLLEIIEIELAVGLSPEELNVLREYLRSNPHADVKDVIKQAQKIVEKKTKTEIEEKKLNNIRRHYLHAKQLLKERKFFPWIELQNEREHKKEQKRQFGKKNSSEQIKDIIKAAEKKLLKDKVVKAPLNPDELQRAIEYYKSHAAEEFSTEDKANIALLGVINVHIAGGIRPVVLHSWGNLLCAPDVNLYHGGSGGGAAIDQANRVDFSHGDPVGLEHAAIVNVIKNGAINTAFLKRLPELDAKFSTQKHLIL